MLNQNHAKMRDEALNVYEIFKEAFGAEKAKTVVSYLENADNKTIETAVNSKTKTLATKEQLYLLKEDLHKTKADLIKWMFIFWVGAVGVLLGSIFAMFQLFLK